MRLRRLFAPLLAGALTLTAAASAKARPPLAFAAAAAVSAISALRRRKRAPPASPLDDPLFTFPEGSPFAVRDMLRSVQVKGITGSGKTSGSIEFLLDAIVAHPRSTIFAIAQKPEDEATLRRIFRRHGREKSLLVVKPGGPKCNLVDSLVQAGGDARAITELITTLGESLDAATAGGRENDQYWRQLERRIIFSAVEAVRQGAGRVTIPDLLEFITTAPYSTATLSDPGLRAAFEQKFHYRTMQAAAARPKTTIEQNDWEVVLAFWSNEFIHMDEKPRSSGLSGVMNTMHAGCTGLARELTGTTSDFTPAAIDNGASILVQMPVAQYGPTGRYVAGGLMHLLQRHVLARRWEPGGYFNVLVCDEFQESVTEECGRYIAMCRSHGGCMLTATQTVHSEYGRMPGHAGHHKADALRSNYGLHIFHLVDPDTAEAASKLLGQRLQVTYSGGSPDCSDAWELMTGRARPHINYTEHWLPVLQPSAFYTNVRTGGPANRFLVDAVAVRPGEPFRDGELYQRMTFQQDKR